MDRDRLQKSQGALQEHGFSMVELLCAFGILLAVMAGVYSLMIQNEKIYQVQLNLADMQQNARVALDLMTRDIRMAGADPSGRAFAAPNTDLPIESATVDSFWVKSDRPYDPDDNGFEISDKSSPADNDTEDDDENEFGDGFLNDEGESVEYHLAGETLYRKLKNRNPEVDQPIADNVTAFTVHYFKKDGTELAPPVTGSDLADISRIALQITVRSRDKDLDTRAYKEFTLGTEVTIRNR
jgi:type IV pilus assembly protein PilW